MASRGYVVDHRLAATPIARLLDVRARLRKRGTIDPEITVAGDRPVLSGDQTLGPGVGYASEHNPRLMYYLPEYRVSTREGGRPAVELRFAAGAADEVGRLTVDFTWTALRGRDHQMRVLNHVAALTLRYRVPVEAQGAEPAADGSGWEQDVSLQPLQQMGDGLARSATIFTDKAQFDAVYQAMQTASREAVLVLEISARVGVRTWRQVVVGRADVAVQKAVLKYSGALFTDMLRKESLDTIRRTSGASTARVMMVAAPPEVSTRLEAARISMASPVLGRQLLSRIAVPALHRAVAEPGVVSRSIAVAARPGVSVRVRPAPRGGGTRPARPVVRDHRTRDTDAPAGRPVVRDHRTRGTDADPGRPVVRDHRTRPARPAVRDHRLLARVRAPRLSDAVSVSDLRIGGRKAVPIRVALDTERAPAVVSSDLQNVQRIPFSFDPGQPANADVYAVEGFDSGGIHLLLALRLVAPDGSTHVVYQDNLMRDVVHVAPSEFRLERDVTAPFLPAICFLASEFSTTDNEEEAEVLFRVSAVYRLEPWLDPDVVELARAELNRQGLVARFTTTVSKDAKLSLDLDLLGDEQQRDEAAVDPAIGITDTLDLDHETFVRLWRERLANPASGGVSGRVDYRLFDGSAAQVKVRLSLWDTSAELFDVTFTGPVADQPGRYRVLVRNRVESPARVTDLPGEAIEGGGVAHAVEPASVLGQVLQPQEELEIDYQLEEGGASLATFDPLVLGRTEPDLPALLKLLMLTPGYSALGFSLTVRAADGVFGPATEGAEPLTGLIVEFDDGTRATLAPDDDETEVTLVGRLTDQILGTADESQRYFYRVTNLHAAGEGARTSWIAGQGTSALEVGTAVVDLDF